MRLTTGGESKSLRSGGIATGVGSCVKIRKSFQGNRLQSNGVSPQSIGLWGEEEQYNERIFVFVRK